jgi:hypothetical protein
VKLGFSHRGTNRLRVFGKRVLRSIFGLKRKKVAGGWRRVHNELCTLHASPHIINVIKSRRMRWAGHVANMEEMKNAYKILIG